MASATQFVVVESSHSDAKWFNYYQQLLHHFYWASVWWPPNATVQKHKDVTGGSDSLTIETKVESSLNQVACTEDEQDDYESCSDGGTSEGCSVYSCSSRIINNGTGSKYFHHEFDEHGQDLLDYSCTEIRRVDSQYNSSCLRQRVEKWPSRRKKQSVVGDKADEPLRNSFSNTAPQWEALPQDGQHWSGDSAITSRDGGQLTQCGDECDSQDDFSENGIELCDWCGAVGQCTVLDDEVICRACRNTAADDEAADDVESNAEVALPGSQETAGFWPAFRQADAWTTLQEPLGCQACDWCGKDGVACFLHDDDVLCKSCLKEGTCFCGSFCSYEDRGVCVECGGPCREEDLFGRAGSSSEGDHGAGGSDDAVSESECDLCGKASPGHRRDGVLTCHSCYLHLYSQDSDSDDVPEVPFFPPGKCEGQLQGLVGSACLNGHWAVFWQFHEDKNRWEVTVSGKRVLVKKENIDFGTMRFTPGG